MSEGLDNVLTGVLQREPRSQFEEAPNVGLGSPAPVAGQDLHQAVLCQPRVAVILLTLTLRQRGLHKSSLISEQTQIGCFVHRLRGVGGSTKWRVLFEQPP